MKQHIKKFLKSNLYVWRKISFFSSFIRVYRKKTSYFIKYLLNRSKIKHIYEESYSGKAIGILPTDDAIGILIFWGEYAIRTSRLRGYDLTRDVVFIAGETSPNDVYLDLLGKSITIQKDPEFHRLLLYKDGYRFLEKKGLLVSSQYLRDGTVFYPDAPKTLYFSIPEKNFGDACLEELGIDKNRPLITLHNKDAHYYQQLGKQKTWDIYRDSGFETLLPTLTHLKNEGYQCVRMGHYEDFTHSGHIPYISLNTLNDKKKRQFLDFYLQEKAVISICGSSGIGFIPWQLKTPILGHNYIPMGYTIVMDNGIFIPRLILNKKTGRYVTTTELFKYKIHFSVTGFHISKLLELTGDMFTSQDFYQLYDLETIDNTAEEILEGVKETLLFQKDALFMSEQQKKRQEQFRLCLPINHPLRQCKGIMSPYFLEKYDAYFCQ